MRQSCTPDCWQSWERYFSLHKTDTKINRLSNMNHLLHSHFQSMGMMLKKHMKRLIQGQDGKRWYNLLKLRKTRPTDWWIWPTGCKVSWRRKDNSKKPTKSVLLLCRNYNNTCIHTHTHTYACANILEYSHVHLLWDCLVNSTHDRDGVSCSCWVQHGILG